jgi:hypothetical protein
VENVNIVMDSNSVISEFERFSPSDIDDPLFEICSDIRVSPVSTPETSENEKSGEEEVRNDPFVSLSGATFELGTLRTEKDFFLQFFPGLLPKLIIMQSK